MDNSITQEELENVAKLYDRIRSLFRKKIPELDTQIAEDFENHVKTIMGDYSAKVGKENELPYGELDSFSLITKNRLYVICADKAIELAAAYDKKLATVIRAVFKAKENVFNSIAEFEKIQREGLTAARRKLSANGHLLEDELQIAKSEVADVLETAETLEKEMHQIREEQNSLLESRT